jgi:hypothetical protein
MLIQAALVPAKSYLWSCRTSLSLTPIEQVNIYAGHTLILDSGSYHKFLVGVQGLLFASGKATSTPWKVLEWLPGCNLHLSRSSRLLRLLLQINPYELQREVNSLGSQENFGTSCLFNMALACQSSLPRARVIYRIWSQHTCPLQARHCKDRGQSGVQFLISIRQEDPFPT